MAKFYEMGNGNLVAEAGRGVTVKRIKKLQKTEWAKRQGGICAIRIFTEPRAIFFAQRGFDTPCATFVACSECGAA